MTVLLLLCLLLCLSMIKTRYVLDIGVIGVRGQVSNCRELELTKIDSNYLMVFDFLIKTNG